MLIHWTKRYLGGIILCFGLAILVLAGADSKISSTEWKAKRKEFKTKYKSKKPNERIEAVQIIEPLWGKFEVASDAVEAMRLILDVLASEEDESVAKTAINCLTKLPQQPAALQWLLKNYKSISRKLGELGKLRLIEAINKFKSKGAGVVNFLIELTKVRSVKVRLAALKALSRPLLAKNHRLTPEVILTLVSLTRDKDESICTAALTLLNSLRDNATIPHLINALKKERRKDIKEKIAQTLEAITKQHHGTNVNAWRKWWKQQAKSKVSEAEVNQAINKGKYFLIQRYEHRAGQGEEAELVFYTLINAGLPEDDSLMESTVKTMMTKHLGKIYNVALLALALCDLNRVKYQDRLVQCAQFLLGNQSPNGNWSYGEPIKNLTPIPTGVSDKPIISGDGSSSSDNEQSSSTTYAVKKKEIKVPPRQKRAGTTWDNSNTQYALLGLRACAEAGIVIPQATWRDAANHLAKTQASDGGWCYNARGGPSYGSMSAGGLASLAICLHYQNKEVKKDYKLKLASQWLGNNFTVRENPFCGKWHYYYLYAVERAGVLYDTEFFGKHEWYQIGARYLLTKQAENGSWNNDIKDTCFAVLFLRRATKSLRKPKFIKSGSVEEDPDK